MSCRRSSVIEHTSMLPSSRTNFHAFEENPYDFGDIGPELPRSYSKRDISSEDATSIDLKLTEIRRSRNTRDDNIAKPIGKQKLIDIFIPRFIKIIFHFS